MKKTIIMLICFLGMVHAVSANRVVTISRSNGLFGFYSDIEQKFLGYYTNGTEAWTLECHNPGFISCRLRPMAGKSVRDAEIEGIEDTKLSDLMIDIESNQISNSQPTGSTLRHYQSTLSDNTTVDIYINISWTPDTANPGSTVFSADISHQ